MKIGIYYASKTGTTRRCAMELQRLLQDRHEVTLVELGRETADVRTFDLAVIGSNVRIGHIAKPARAFLKAQEAALLERKTAFFLCMGAPEQAEQTFALDFPEALLKHALCRDCFGGEMEVAAQKGFFDRLIIKSIVQKPGFQPPRILDDRIRAFAERLGNGTK